MSAIFIVGLHCFRFNDDLYTYWFVCSARFGVPCFFIISAFFLFKKDPDWNKMKQFTKRIAKLYLFWLIATAPFTIYLRLFANHSISFTEKILNLIHTSLFSASFSGSWYLMALLQCSFIIYFLVFLISHTASLCSAKENVFPMKILLWSYTLTYEVISFILIVYPL